MPILNLRVIRKHRPGGGQLATAVIEESLKPVPINVRHNIHIGSGIRYNIRIQGNTVNGMPGATG